MSDPTTAYLVLSVAVVGFVVLLAALTWGASRVREWRDERADEADRADKAVARKRTSRDDYWTKGKTL